MKRYIIMSALIAGFSSCTVSKKKQKDVYFGVRAAFMPRLAISRFLMESTASIYKLNEGRQITASTILIRSLNAHFYNGAHSFDLNLDSVTTIVTKDTITFSKLSFPLQNRYLSSDTIDVRVTCKYMMLDSLSGLIEKCLLSNYIIYRDSIAQKDSYSPCSF
jgi:hypothetical protein